MDYYLNGQKIKIRGVNHHDTNSENGYTMSNEDILKDILLCKQYNINEAHFQQNINEKRK